MGLLDLDAFELAELVGAGELRVEEVARAIIARVGARDEIVHGWSFFDPQRLLAEARELDRRENAGPLLGLPIGIKDVILTRDMPTGYNSPAYAGFHPGLDADCVRLLRRAGALIVGKTHTVEFASTGTPPPTSNPHNAHHTPGGSSSGSAAVVADRQVALALGTQTGGSMIRPASFCGVWAVKPSWNLVSMAGVKTFATSLDTLGWFGRSARDLELLYRVLVPEWQPLEPPSIEDARIAICHTPWWDLASPGTIAALQTTADALREAGATVEMLSLPEPFARLREMHLVLMRMEARAAFLADTIVHGDKLSEGIRQYERNDWRYTFDDLAEAHDLAAACRSEFDALVRPYDAVIAPSTIGEAPAGLGNTGDMVFNAIWTLLHVPCVNVPGCKGPGGLPIGVTVTGRRYSDPRVLAMASVIGDQLGVKVP